MSSDATQTYFALNAKRYRELIQELLEQVEQRDEAAPETTIIKARKDYFETALAKGVDLSTLPFDDIATWDAHRHAEEAEDLPDKEAQGWQANASALISPAYRREFAEAGARRARRAAMEHDFCGGGTGDNASPRSRFASVTRKDTGLYRGV